MFALRRHRGVLGVLGAVAALALVPAAAPAATFSVTKVEDSDDGTCDTDCSLREGVRAANDSPGDDTVLVPPGLYLLDGDELRIDGFSGEETFGSLSAGGGDMTTLVGAGANRTIVDADGDSRVFQIGYSAAADISGVTIKGGVVSGEGGDGGGILSYGSLVLTDSALAFNSSIDGDGGGIASYGSLSVTRTLVTRNGAGSNGAGIYNGGSAEIVDSAIDANVSDNDGGGVYTRDGLLEITRSTLNRNEAEDQGGGLYLSGGEGGEARLENVTVSGNDANINFGSGEGGGIYASGGLVDILHSTIANNQAFADDGGGIATGENGSGAEITVQNTIISGNRSERGSDDCNGGLVSNGGNVESGDDCSLDGQGDQVDAEAGLEPLAGNGGPTSTHALAPESDAIDGALSEACTETDQRGADRPPPAGSAGAGCDAGALEAGALGDLRVAFKAAAPSPATVGQRLTYTILAVNDGPDTVTGAQVTDDLPPGASFVSASASSGTCAGADVVVCELPPLASGDSVLITIVVTPTAPGTLSNRATVDAIVTDLEEENDAASVDVAVNPGPGSPPATIPEPAEPELNLSVRRRQVLLSDFLKDGVVVVGGCSNGCSLRFRLLAQDRSGNISPARFNQVLARSYVPYATANRTVRLRPCFNKRARRQSRSCLRRLRRGLRGKPFTTRVEAIATSKDGVRTRDSESLRVR